MPEIQWCYATGMGELVTFAVCAIIILAMFVASRWFTDHETRFVSLAICTFFGFVWLILVAANMPTSIAKVLAPAQCAAEMVKEKTK